MYAGNRYNQKLVNKNSTTRWTCASRTCSGSVTTDSNNTVIYKNQHSCIPDLAKTEVEKCLQNCRKRARDELTPVPKIFHEEISKVKDVGLDFVTEVPNLVSKKSSLYRQRRQTFGVTVFANREHIVLPQHLSDDFLLVDDGVEDSILAFSNTGAREALVQSQDFFGDGTFKSFAANLISYNILSTQT